MALLDQFGREIGERPRLCGFVPPPQPTRPTPPAGSPVDAIATKTIALEED